MAFSASDLATLADAANRLLVAGATELPVDANAVIPELAGVAVNEGFSPSTGRFFEAIKLKPVSTMILFVAFAAGSGVTLPPQ